MLRRRLVPFPSLRAILLVTPKQRSSYLHITKVSGSLFQLHKRKSIFLKNTQGFILSPLLHKRKVPSIRTPRGSTAPFSYTKETPILHGTPRVFLSFMVLTGREFPLSLKTPPPLILNCSGDLPFVLSIHPLPCFLPDTHPALSHGCAGNLAGYRPSAKTSGEFFSVFPSQQSSCFVSAGGSLIAGHAEKNRGKSIDRTLSGLITEELEAFVGPLV